MPQNRTLRQFILHFLKSAGLRHYKSLTIENATRDAVHGPVMLKFFLGSVATTSANLVKFIASGIDAVIFGGMPRKIVFKYLKKTPNHPPIVFCTYSHVAEEEFKLMRPCAVGFEF